MRMNNNSNNYVPQGSDILRSSSKILDHHDREFDYLRLAVNEKCNLRCIYCMPEEGIDFRSKDKLLTTQEIFLSLIHI